MTRSVTRRHRSRWAAAATIAAVLIGAITALGPAAGAQPVPVGNVLHYAVLKDACAVPKTPDAVRCYAVERVPAAKGTPGARAYTTAGHSGPLGGFSPADLARLYNVNPDGWTGATQTIGIVDWDYSTSAAADLDAFDAQYGLPAETTTSFRIVNESGQAAPLPATVADNGEALETALDIEAARGLCHRCKIVLVEANAAQAVNLAHAVNSAVALGATEVSNSYGAPEDPGSPPSSSVVYGYDHPGVVVTASTGDSGWYDWTDAFATGGASSNAPSFPASLPYVVAVAGTRLITTSTGARASETVWDSNAPEDPSAQPLGASGGGCSVLYSALSFQATAAGYAAAGCATKARAHTRLTADIAAVADPMTGFDVYVGGAWQTVGGTSLASPVVAAMWALAGGAGGTAYAAQNLYDNNRVYPGLRNDVTAGGNGFCGGDTTSHCASVMAALYGTDNPNNLANGNTVYYGGWAGLLDCSFPYDGAEAPNPPRDPECNAAPGYDGASGIGTPHDIRVFMPLPRVTVSHPASLRLNYAATFSQNTVDGAPNAKIVSAGWNFGDGTGTVTGTSSSTTHTFRRAGRYTVSFTVRDNFNRTATGSTVVTVGMPLYVRFNGPTTVHRGVNYTFTDSGSKDYNTGGSIVKVAWSWGDGYATYGASVAHHWARTGRYTITEILVDSTGVRTSRTVTETVVA